MHDAPAAAPQQRVRMHDAPAPGAQEPVERRPAPARHAQALGPSPLDPIKEGVDTVMDSCAFGADANMVSAVPGFAETLKDTAKGVMEQRRSADVTEEAFKKTKIIGQMSGGADAAATWGGVAKSGLDAVRGFRSKATSQAVREDDRRGACESTGMGMLQAGLASAPGVVRAAAKGSAADAAKAASKASDIASPVGAGIAMLVSGKATYDAAQQQGKARAVAAEFAQNDQRDGPVDMLEALTDEQVRQITSYIVHKKGLSAARNGSSTFAAALSLTAGLVAILGTNGAATPLVVGALTTTSTMGTSALGLDKIRRKQAKRAQTKRLLPEGDRPSGFTTSEHLAQLRDDQLSDELEDEALDPVELALRMADGNPLRERLHYAEAILAMVDRDPAEDSPGMRLLDTIGKKELVMKVRAESNFGDALATNREVVDKVKEGLAST